MCAECGADLRTDEVQIHDAAVVPMVHSVPDLKVSGELAQKLGREDANRLLKDRKLVLLVDLDQTLVHTTNDDLPPNLKGVLHFFLRGPGSQGRWCHTRLRPKTEEFLESASKNYELHVCTFGARQYAHAIAELLDPQKKYFSHRILSRDECFDARTKSANLKALFPCGDNMVCIIDDREDVWRHASNLIHVRPYSFFQSTGDINAPSPLFVASDEKARLPSGKNGTQPISNQMPSLETEPVKELKETKLTEQNEVKLSSNGKIVAKENKIETDKNKENKDISKENDIEEAVKEDKVVSAHVDKEPDKDTQNESETLKTDEKLHTIDEQKENHKKLIIKDDKQTNNLAEKEPEQGKPVINPNVPVWVATADGQIEVDDADDYLIYLDDILKRIHKEFYNIYDTMGKYQIPDLKYIIPEVKSKVLEGASLVFSGLVPTHQRIETSRAYQVAKSLGAEVTQDFNEKTTHLVAVRSGTAKVNASRKMGDGKNKIHVVTPEWLWTCAERWERVDERLYPLQRGGQSSARRPPAHCSSPPPAPPPRKRTPSGRFMDTLNPLLSFSSDDIADMDREVEDIFNESDEDSTDEEKKPQDDVDDEENMSEDRLLSLETSKSSQDSRLLEKDEDEHTSDSNTDGERPRKRPRPSTPTSDDDDSSWNLMGAALEREFLAQD